jgi:AraC family transcriptional regulator of arabinose operon
MHKTFDFLTFSFIIDDMRITRIGIEVKHDRHFVIDRPHGSGDFLFLHFSTPIFILNNGRKIKEKENTCMLYTPGVPQWYSGIGKGFKHNWFHFTGKRAEQIVRSFRIPLNQCFYPSKIDFKVDLKIFTISVACSN